jgi:hypothetical protein
MQTYEKIENPWTLEAISLKKKVREHLNLAVQDIPDVLRLLIKKDCILSGSSISSIYHNEQPKDYDLWLKVDAFETAEAIKANIVEKYSDAILDIADNYGQPGAKGTPQPCVTANAITFKNKFQLIFIGDYHSERKNFDFLHCTPYFDLDTDKFYISERQFRAIRDKQLIIHSKTRKMSEYRIQKFMSRGWKALECEII